MMKRVKDDEKMMQPMFPRLHVNDTEKGGPRAPPRNKMALYEQLSIPSQRFNHSMQPNNTDGNSVPPSSQGSGNERDTIFSYQLTHRHQSDMQYNQYTNFSTQVEGREKSDDDDFSVPIFNHSLSNEESVKYTDTDAPSNNSLKPQEAKETSMHEVKNQKRVNLKQFVGGFVKSISNSLNTESPKKIIASALSHEQGDDPKNSVERLKTDAILLSKVNTELQITSNKQNSAFIRNSQVLPSENQNTGHDLSNVTESCEDGSCGSSHIGNLERADSISDASNLDSDCGQDMITPDDVVGVVGQKHFWKARRVISNQQRVFAVQVFELHRLIKVQRLMAASPNILLEDSAYLGKPIKASPIKKLPLPYPIKAVPNTPKPKNDTDKPSHKKDIPTENTVEKTSFSSAQNVAPPSNGQLFRSNSPAPSTNNDHYPKPLFFSQPNGHQWLIPVMSPSEGLIYKPYPASGFTDGGYGPPGSDPAVTGNFLSPNYGFPDSHTPYQLPSFPPNGYFPMYGTPMMNPSMFSVSSVEQLKPSAVPGSIPVNIHPDAHKLNGSEDLEVQDSTASSPSERQNSNRKASSGSEGRNVLSLFPTSLVTNSETERPTRVIKVVPHNARIATESAARIFQSIQEERKQYDSV